jgi:uncharacterized membrane protein
MGAVDALTASWRLTKGSKVDLFVFGLVVGGWWVGESLAPRCAALR